MRVLLSRLDVRVSLTYFVVATLWIVTSDAVATNLFSANPTLLNFASLFKGLGFVLVTTAVLYFVVSRELRKRIRVQEELQQEREIMPVGIVILVPTGAIRYANAQAERILRLTRSSIVQETYDAPVWHVADFEGNPLPNERLPFAQVMQTRQSVYGIQHAIEWPDGKRVLLEINATPVFAADGTLREVVTTLNDVTSDYQNAKLLRESEIHYRLLFENNPRPMWIFDLETLAFMEVNKAAVTQYGYSRDEFLALRLTDIRPPEDLARLLDHMQQPRLEFQRSGEWRHRLKNGQIIDVDITSHTLNYAGRDAVFVIAQDITTRKLAEAALHESEERYRLLINSLKDYAVFSVDLEGNITSWNGGAERIIGYRKDEIIGKHFSVFYTPEDLAADRPTQILKLAVEQNEFHDEQWRVRKDGSRFWADVYIVCIRDETGALRGFSRVTRDLTERKQAQLALDASEKRFRTLIEKSTDMIVLYGPDLQFLYTSPSSRTILGYSFEEMSPEQRAEYIHPDDVQVAMEVLDRVLEHPGAAITYEVRLRHRDASWRYFESTARNLLNDPAVAAIVLNAHDITEQKQAAEAIVRLNQRLTVLRQIDTDIIAAQSTEAIFEAVVKNILQLIPCTAASVVLFDEAVSEATILATTSEGGSIAQPNKRFVLNQNPMLEILKSGETLLIPDLTKVSNRLSELGITLMNEGIYSVLNAPLMVQGQLIGSLGLTSETPDFFTSEHEQILQEVANQLAVALQSARLKDAMQKYNQQLQTLSARIVEAQEIERGHIARELHDEVGQTLTALSLLLSAAKRQHEIDERPPDLQQAKLLIAELTGRIRDISLDLRPSMLDDLGLIPTLIWYLERYQQQTGISVNLKYSDVERRFAPVIETTLYRIIQESLTNVARHARVDSASLRLWAASDTIHAQIEDTGRGFDLEAVRQANKTGGLLGLHERAQLAGGICEIVSNSGDGTLVSVNIPL